MKVYITETGTDDELMYVEVFKTLKEAEEYAKEQDKNCKTYIISINLETRKKQLVSLMRGEYKGERDFSTLETQPSNNIIHY